MSTMDYTYDYASPAQNTFTSRPIVPTTSFAPSSPSTSIHNGKNTNLNMSTMDYAYDYASSAQNNTFTSTSNPSNSISSSASLSQSSGSITAPERKANSFYSWHEKAGIRPPRNYLNYASRPVPFSSTPHRLPGSAASDYIDRISHSPSTASKSDSDEETGPRDTSHTHTPCRQSPKAGQWPCSQFGTQPYRRGCRASAIAREPKLRPEEYPPLASVYDTLATTPAQRDLQPALPLSPKSVLTPTAVRVENFPSDRFPDVVRALRLHGVILEAYSGLPDRECHLLDPEIYPRDKLDAAVLEMVQPCAREGWVRITFAVKEAAMLAVESAERGELVVGGLRVRVGWWTEEKVERAVEEPMMETAGEYGVSGAQQDGAGESVWVRGATRAAVKPVEFAKVDGFWWGLAKAALGGSEIWFGEVFKWVMDEVIGFKNVFEN